MHPKRNSTVTLSPALEAETKESGRVTRSTAKVKRLVAQHKKGSDTWAEECRKRRTTTRTSGCPENAAEEAALAREARDARETEYDDPTLDDGDFFGTKQAERRRPALCEAQKAEIAARRDAALAKKEALRRGIAARREAALAKKEAGRKRTEEEKAVAVFERPAILKRKHAAELAHSRKRWAPAKVKDLAKPSTDDDPTDFSTDDVIEMGEQRLAAKHKKELENLESEAPKDGRRPAAPISPQPGPRRLPGEPCTLKPGELKGSGGHRLKRGQ